MDFMQGSIPEKIENMVFEAENENISKICIDRSTFIFRRLE
jgi:hypothetical protein